MDSSSAKKRKLNPTAKKAGSSKNIPLEMISCYNSEQIHFDGIKLSGTEPPMTLFLESGLIFPSIMLENVTFSKDHKLFWEKCGKNFTELIVKNCIMPAYDLIEMLKNLSNLTKLTILDSSTICKNLVNDLMKNNKNLFVSSSKLTSFKIDESWNEMGASVLAKWLSEMPNITEFEIGLVDEEEELFTIDSLKLWETKLTSLRIKNKISAETRKKLFELNISQLEVLQIGSVDEELNDAIDWESDDEQDSDNGNDLVEFISKQKNLLELCIGICNVGEKFLERITQYSAKWKVLEIYNTRNLEDKSKILALLGQVSKLHFSVQCYYSLDKFLELPNNKLTHLKLDVTRQDDEDRDYRRYYDIPFHTMNGFMSLTHFDVSDQYICGVDIQEILKRLIGLEVLKVKTKHTLTDFAFSGKGNQYPKCEKYTPFSIKGFRKGPFYQLGRLKNLIELDIQTTDNKFTDLALDRISKLKNLKIINLSNYTKITIFGIGKMIALCQNLELINITGCKKKIASEISLHFKKRVIKIINKKVKEE